MCITLKMQRPYPKSYAHYPQTYTHFTCAYNDSIKHKKPSIYHKCEGVTLLSPKRQNLSTKLINMLWISFYILLQKSLVVNTENIAEINKTKSNYLLIMIIKIINVDK